MGIIMEAVAYVRDDGRELWYKFSGHYITSINCCKKVYIKGRKITEFEMTHIYCMCSNI